jgi:hypothetical protein
MRKFFMLITIALSSTLCFAEYVIAGENISSENFNLGLYSLKLKQYELDKFQHTDKIYALAMATILPGAGHVYAGEPSRGVSFVGAEFVCAIIYMLGLEAWEKADTDDEWRRASGTMSIGSLGFLIFKVFEWYDAMLLIDEKNVKLRKQLDLMI